MLLAATDSLVVLTIALGVLCCGSLAYWIAVFARILRSIRAAPVVAEGLNCPEPDGGWPRVSIIVPAHNEQRVIDACAASLRAQDYPNLEIIFVLDRCTDDTAAILAEHAKEDSRLRVIENGHCPEDWAGKCNAARIGAETAAGDWLLFTDADTKFEPQLVRASVGCAIERRMDLLSILSTLSSERGFERFVQPVAAMFLMSLYPIELVNRRDGGRPFANGQFLLFRRAMYERIGGHAAVKDDLCEDIAAARHIAQASGACGLVRSGGMLHVSMYDNFAAFTQGWKRIYIEACKRKPARLRKTAWRIVTIGLLAPAAQVGAIVLAILLLVRGDGPELAIVTLAVVAAGLLVQYASLVWIYALSDAPMLGAALYSFGCWHVARIFFSGASDLSNRRPVRWGGRTYVLQPR